jgi:HD-GYP domain-containing protein (c-di-GMP phosphodiesterase class II)
MDKQKHADVATLLHQLTDVEESLLRVTTTLNSRIHADSNASLQQEQRLFDAFIKMMAHAIDRKSHHTGIHCMRVPILSEMIVRALCESTEGSFRDFTMSEEERYEFHVACWLHDCGKIVTPPHILDKAAKLETVVDRIGHIATRFELAMRDADTNCSTLLDREQLHDLLELVRRLNHGMVPVTDAVLEQLAVAGDIVVTIDGKEEWLLTEEEITHLSIRHGTITDEERRIMRDHVVHTAEMLKALPWPQHLRRVPDYAVAHHERMDGKGYPYGTMAGTLPLPARILAMADVFEAVTANDRPYRRTNRLSEAVKIMADFKRDNHLDPELVDFFIGSGLYRDYANLFLDPEQIDEVDEMSILTIQPKAMAA